VAYLAENDVDCVVSDYDMPEQTGIEFLEAVREEIFEDGYSTSERGSGLSIVKQIADVHDWEIRVTDGSEGGTRCEITGVEFNDE